MVPYVKVTNSALTLSTRVLVIDQPRRFDVQIAAIFAVEWAYFQTLAMKISHVVVEERYYGILFANPARLLSGGHGWSATSDPNETCASVSPRAFFSQPHPGTPRGAKFSIRMLRAPQCIYEGCCRKKIQTTHPIARRNIIVNDADPRYL